MTEMIAIRPKRFIKANDYTGNTNIFLRISVDNTAQKTEPCFEHEKNLIWKKSLMYKITSQQLVRSDTVEIIFEAFYDDFGHDELVGKVFVRLSQIKLKAEEVNVFNVVDLKSKIIGKIEVEFELNPKNYIGTLVVKPTGGKFENITDEHQQLYLVFVHGDLAYQTDMSEGPAQKPVFKDVLTFQQLEFEELTVRCFTNTSHGNEMVGEAQIPISSLQKRGGYMSLVAYLINNKKKVGDINLEFEFYSETFKNPVNVYPTVTVKKGEYVSKKVKYSNLEGFQKHMAVKSDNRDLVFPRTEAFDTMPHGFGEIRFKFIAPKGSKGTEERCRVDIVRLDTNTIEESFLFKVKSI